MFSYYVSLRVGFRVVISENRRCNQEWIIQTQTTLITRKQKVQSGMDNTETQTTLITRKQKGQSGMDNTETQTTFITRKQEAIRNE